MAAEKAAAARRAAWCGMQLWLARRRRAGTGAVSNPAATFGRGAICPIGSLKIMRIWLYCSPQNFGFIATAATAEGWPGQGTAAPSRGAEGPRRTGRAGPGRAGAALLPPGPARIAPRGSGSRLPRGDKTAPGPSLFLYPLHVPRGSRSGVCRGPGRCGLDGLRAASPLGAARAGDLARAAGASGASLPGVAAGLGRLPPPPPPRCTLPPRLSAAFAAPAPLPTRVWGCWGREPGSGFPVLTALDYTSALPCIPAVIPASCCPTSSLSSPCPHCPISLLPSVHCAIPYPLTHSAALHLCIPPGRGERHPGWARPEAHSAAVPSVLLVPQPPGRCRGRPAGWDRMG